MTRTELENQTPAASRLRTAWALAAAGSLFLAAGPLLGVVDGAEPAYTSWPLLAVLALLPPVVAGVLLQRGRPFVAAGVLAAAGAFAIGRLLSDVQIVADALAVGRPELFRPTSLDPLDAAPGLWLLLLGHLLTFAAGVMAAGRAGVPADESEQRQQNHVLLFLAVAALATVGLLGDGYSSSDAYLLARSPWDLPFIGLVGGFLIAAAPLAAAAFGGSSPDPDTRRGNQLGVALGIAAVVTPPLVAASTANGLSVTWGPIVALVAAAALIAMFFFLDEGEEKEEADIALPTLNKVHAAAGAFAVLAAVVVLAGAMAPQLVVAIGETPEFFAARLIWPAGIALAVLGLLMFGKNIAGAVRPALIMAAYAVSLATTASVQAVLAASESSLAQPGTGFWLVIAEGPLAVIAVICAAVAGAMERENTERRETIKRQELPIAELGAVLLAGLFAAGAFALPTMRGTDYTAPSILAGDAVESGPLLGSLLVLVIALVVALRSRPERGAGLLAGAALVAGVRALELPLTGGRIEGVAAGPGTWLALACVAALLVAAGLTGARASR
ncbi:hypothetical protein LFM09_30590 [Lentzea alba]|uniref:hypothetical protein n=1 Tax=Lentzea alba TaxID=2714351 RepID=UPI0039BFFEFA